MKQLRQRHTWKRNKSKQSISYKIKLSNPLNGNYNHNQGRVLGIVLLLLFLSLGSLFVYGTPAFHSYIHNPNYHKPDPYTLIWNGTVTGSGNSPFQTNAPYTTMSITTPKTNTLQIIKSGDLIVVSLLAEDSNCFPCGTVTDTFSTTFTRQVERNVAGTITNVLFTGFTNQAGSDVISVSLAGGANYVISSSSYTFVSSIGNTNSNTAASGATSSLTLTTSANSFIVQNEQWRVGVGCPSSSLVPQNGQTSRTAGCNLSAFDYEDSGPYSSGSQTVNVQCVGSAQCPTVSWVTTAIELKTSVSSFCPVGYQCLNSNVDSGNHVTSVANSTFSSIALTNSPISLTVGSAKELLLFETWHNTTNLIYSKPFGWYLTNNATLPLTQNYNPLNDPQVSMVNVIYPMVSPSLKNGFIYMQKDIGKSLLSSSGLGENPVQCPQTTTLYICNSETNAYTSTYTSITNTLNYTGSTGNSESLSLFCDGGTPTTLLFCSQNIGNSASPCTGTATLCSTRTLPFLNVQSQYYIGFFSFAGQTGTIKWGTSNTGAFAERANAVYYWVPNPTTQTPATLDTGGFFGPLVRALVSLGVFMLQNTILFIAFLYGLLVPLIAGLATIMSAFLVIILNAFGNIFGDNQLGIQISSAFTQIFNYLTTIFTGALTLWSNVLTMLLNMLNTIIQFFTTFQVFIEAFLLGFVSLIIPITTVWNDILHFYNLGSFTIQEILVFWYIFLMFKVYTEGIQGFRDGLEITELFTLKIFKSGYWFIDEAYSFVVQLKQLLFGNRVSPVSAVG